MVILIAVFIYICGNAVAQVAGLRAIENFEDYPFLQVGVQPHYISSYDRTGGNSDGFAGTYSALYVDDVGEHVIFDVKGPGCVYTLWFTGRRGGWSPLDWGRIRFYFDDEPKPRLDKDAQELFTAGRPPFTAPFVFHAFQSTGGYVCYLPFPFRKRLKITTEKRVGFYNVYYHTYAPDREVPTWTGAGDTHSVARLWNAPGVDPKSTEGNEYRSGVAEVPAPARNTPGMVTLLQWKGAGSVASIRVNPLFPLTPYQLNHISLRIWWDGESTPSVYAPLGSFFGSGLGEAAVRAVPLGMSPSGAYYCYLPMPFWSEANIELVNDNPAPTPKIWWEIAIKPQAAFAYPKERCGYFKALYRKEWPTTAGRDYQILDTQGSGVLVGQVMTVEPLHAENKRWWEGDLRIYLDGMRHPAFHGTGHEDEYLGGWSNEWLMNPYSLPMHGEPMTRDLTQVDGQWNASTTVYRFFPAGIAYQSQISVSTEHGVANSAVAFYSSVAFYYEQARRAEKIDDLDVGNQRDEDAHGYRTEGAARLRRDTFQFEGVADRVDVTEDGRELSTLSRFTLRIPRACSDLRLRRLYDQQTAQEAEVWVNGQRVGIWYAPATNAHKRWAESDFLLPSSLARAQSELHIEIRVRKGIWTEYRYGLWGVQAPGAAPQAARHEGLCGASP